MFTKTKKLSDMNGSKYIILPDDVVAKWPPEVDIEIDDNYITIRPHKNGDNPKEG